MKKPPFVLAIAATTLALTLTACGTTEDGDNSPADSGERIALTDSRGKKIELDGPATKVVAVEWSPAEQLVTLGVMPIGVADVKGFKVWDKSVELDDSVKDVGTRGEPSSDSIAALNPDLIIAANGLPENVISQLETRAPVLVVAAADAKDSLGTMRADFELIAKAVGMEDKAKVVLANLDEELADAKTEIAEAKLDTTRFALADAYVNGANVEIRMFGKGSLLSDVAGELGLENVWDGKIDEQYGLGQTDIEGLTKLPDVQFFYSASDGDPFTDNLASNPIWKDLAFVKADHVHKLPDGTWTFGGPAAIEYFVDAIVGTLTK